MDAKDIVVRLALNGYRAILLPNEDIEVSRWGTTRRFNLKRIKYDYDEIVKEFSLVAYGFGDETIKKLLAGKKVKVPYGTVNLQGVTLVTEYCDGEISETDLKER